MNALKKENLTKDEWASWSAYHASIQTTKDPTCRYQCTVTFVSGKCKFSGNDTTFYGQCKDINEYLNPGQILILAADQPLFALAKQIQWTWPATHGKDQFVIMFRGLHNEMAVLKMSHVYVILYQINLCLSTV